MRPCLFNAVDYNVIIVYNNNNNNNNIEHTTDRCRYIYNIIIDYEVQIK